MIRCSKCGTINRDNSRFCNECGAPLKPTKILCPACGTLNTVGNVFCDKCNGRLLSGKDMVPPMATKPTPSEAPTPSIKGISLPARQSSPDEMVPERAELPDWLLELTDESGESAPHTPEAASAENLPDWLSSIAPAEVTSPDAHRSAPVQPAPTELPDWLSALAEADMPATPSVQSEAATGLPDWLSEVAPSASARPGIEEAETLPDWLSGPGEELEVEAIEPKSELPDWLSAPEPPIAPVPTSGKKAAAAELPDWMSGLASEEETAPAEAQPDWLSGLTTEEETAPVETQPDWLSGLTTEEETTSTEAQPDWLAGITGEESASAEYPSGGWFEEEEEEETVAPTMPDWMSGLADQESSKETFAVAAPAFEEQPAGWPTEEEFEAAPESYAPAAALPDWLLAIADEETDYTPGGPRELPEWLLKHADPDGLNFESTGPAPLPGWLTANADDSVAPKRAPLPERKVEAAPSRSTSVKTQPEAPGDWASGLLIGATETEVVEEAAATEEEELPDWLRGLEEEAPAAVLEEPSQSMSPSWLSAGAEPEAEESEELPDWLSGVEEVEEKAQEPMSGAADAGLELEEEELPDWLRGLEAEEAPSTPKHVPAARSIPQAATKEAGLPDWLRGIEGAPSASQKETPVAAEADWLSAVAAPESSKEAEIPDWLQGAEPAAVSASGLGEVAGEPEEASELPDWLSGLDTGASARAEVPDARREVHKEPASARDKAPDRLAAVSQKAPLAVEPEKEEEELSLEAEGAESPAMAEIPDWLNNLSPAATEGEEGLAPADENLARAEVPVWLQGLRPSGTGPLPPLPEGAPVSVPDAELMAGEAEGLIRAEIPDWVQKLRPTVTADGEVLPSAAAIEEEGPLAGLSGLIFPKAGIDIPDDFQPQPSPQPSDIIVQQAQLWQQLLEQPRGKAHTVSQERLRPGWGIIAVRLFSVVVLFLAILAGLFLSGDRISQPPPDTARPGVVGMIKTIDALEPDSLVILAVEYGPAEAPEMQVMVDTLLGHLKERQVRVTAVSSLPEGVGLASSILRTNAITNQITFDNKQTLSTGDGLTISTYLPGTYNGIAAFLSDIEKQSPALLLVVSGRSERTRWWIEQNAIRPHAVPLALGVNATTGAVMKPYFAANEVKGWVVGFADTMTYRTSRGALDRPEAQLFEYGQVLDSLMLAHWAAICLIIFGSLYSLAAGKQETKP